MFWVHDKRRQTLQIAITSNAARSTRLMHEIRRCYKENQIYIIKLLQTSKE